VFAKTSDLENGIFTKPYSEV